MPGEPRGTVLMNAGIAPGLTNLLAADLLADHPEADEVELVFTVSAKSAVGPAGQPVRAPRADHGVAAPDDRRAVA